MGSYSGQSAGRDLLAGLVVFLVALPLCLGVALASNAPMFAGLLAGIVGGIVVGSLSGSHTSVSGPAAGLTAVVASQIEMLGSFSGFLVAVVIAGGIQIAMGVAKGGFIASFFPSSVIKGLLAAIGVILILKQIPHLLGHDADPSGEMSFFQADSETTFSEIGAAVFDLHPGAVLIGLLSLGLLVAWGRVKVLKESPVPAPLIVVLLGVAINEWLRLGGSAWVVGETHLVQVPVTSTVREFAGLLQSPDWSVLGNPAVYLAGVTIAIVASLETLLNLDAVDQLDPRQRKSPPNRELIAQGTGNVVAGLIGGLPITSVIVRSSVNINAGNETRVSAIFHGILLLGSVSLVPWVLNRIPLSSLAAILIVTGFKLANPDLFRQMWREGRRQILPFGITVAAIVLTDLLTGILVGLGAALAFILHSNFRRPLQRVVEHHISGDVLRIELANQVSFLNRATLETSLHRVPRGGHVLIDARDTHYIDPDVLDLIEDFHTKTAPAHGVELSLLGFKDEYPLLADRIQYVDYATREVQDALDPERVLDILRQGNERFRTGARLTRDLVRQANATASGQAPLAVIVTCIDSRSPAELVFDLGIGDIFSVRVAGNVAGDKVLASVEYSCVVAGAKLIVVMGHTSCGAVGAAVDLFAKGEDAVAATGCDHLEAIVADLQKSIRPDEAVPAGGLEVRARFVNEVARRNVLHTMEAMRRSQGLDRLLASGTVQLIGALYDLETRRVEFFRDGA